MTSIDTSYCTQVGTPKQHRYAIVLAEQAGYSKLRFAVADATGRSISNVGRKRITTAEASTVIDYLQAKIETAKA